MAFKTEPNTYSIDNLKQDKKTAWDSIRNYQARNFLISMEVGDTCLIYHSNAEPPGIVGIGKVTKKAFPDPLQFEKKSDYYDEKASKEKPRWFCPEISFVKKFSRLIPLAELRESKELKNMVLLKKGSRLSVQPVSDKELEKILELV